MKKTLFSVISSLLVGIMSGYSELRELNLIGATPKDIQSLSFNGLLNGYPSDFDLRRFSNDLKKNFPYAVVSSTSLSPGSHKMQSIPSLTLGLDYSFNFQGNKTSLTQTSIEEIAKRDQVVVVCYIGGNEGASLVACDFLLRYVLFGVVNGHPEVVDLLKKIQLTVVPALNIDQLSEITSHFKSKSVVKLTFKNLHSHAAKCGEGQEDGVNLRFNYGPGFETNAEFCDMEFPGASKESEKETQALMNLIKQETVKKVIAVFKAVNHFGGQDDTFNLRSPPRSSKINSKGGSLIAACREEYKKDCIGLEFIPSNTQDNYFVGSVVVLPMLHRITALILKTASTALGYPFFKAESLSKGVCYNSETIAYCSGMGKKDNVYGLKVVIENLGGSYVPEESVLLELPLGYEILKVMIENKTTTSLIQQPQHSEVSFEKLYFSFNLRKTLYVFNTTSIPVSESKIFHIFTAINKSEVEIGDQAVFNLAKYENSTIKYYEKTASLKPILKDVSQEHHLNPPVVKPPNMPTKDPYEERRVSFLILYAYLIFFIGSITYWCVIRSKRYYETLKEMTRKKKYIAKPE